MLSLADQRPRAIGSTSPPTTAAGCNQALWKAIRLGPSTPDPRGDRAARPFWNAGRLALALGGLAALAVVLTLADPGLTIDEPLDVRPGRDYVATLGRRGWHFFDRTVVDAVFGDNAEHPPLGRWLLGLASTLAEPFEILCWEVLTRSGLTSWPAGSRRRWRSRSWSGWSRTRRRAATAAAAGAVAGFSLLAMPRVFAHAHLAALDTFLSLFWVLALLAAERRPRAPPPAGRDRRARGSRWAWRC